MYFTWDHILNHENCQVRSAGLKISPRKDDLKINPVSLLDDIKDGGWEKGVNLRIKGNSCEIQKLLLSMVGWFCLFLNVSVSLKMKQDTKKSRKSNIKDKSSF